LTITDTDTGESDSLAKAAFIQAISSTVIHYDYDGLYRLIEAQYTGAISATYGYDYDKVGNMIAYTETITSTTAVTRFFDDANRLEISVQDGMTTTYTYDDNGNLTIIDPPEASGTVRYGYDQRNLMITSTVDGSEVASFAYDGMNNRLEQVDFTGATVITTTYANDILGLSQVLIADDGTDQVVNLFGLDLILQDDGAGALALLADGLGSVRLEMVGDAVETITTYSPYGKELAQEGTSDTDYGFTGEQEDGATGLLYLRARYYSNSLRTFMSRDPWGGNGRMPGTFHGYAYAVANPVNHYDPTGRCPAPTPENGYEGSGNVICIAAFIPTAESEGPFGLVYQGDARWFSEDSGLTDSRFWVWIDVDSGEVIRSFVHPTTAVNDLPGLFGEIFNGECHGRNCTYQQPDWTINLQSALIGTDGVVFFNYSVLCSHPTCYLGPGPDGSILLIPDGQGSYCAAGLTERFPNLEAYYWRMESLWTYCSGSITSVRMR
jgi:RHS repeat-associated protein